MVQCHNPSKNRAHGRVSHVKNNRVRILSLYRPLSTFGVRFVIVSSFVSPTVYSKIRYIHFLFDGLQDGA